MPPRPPEVYAQPMCAAGCGRPYTKWHRKCNLVYCDSCVEEKNHKCKPDEVRPYPPKEQPEPQVQDSDQAPKDPPPQMDLFASPPSNGVASKPNAD